MLCFRKFPVAKKFIDKNGGGVRSFRRKFFVSQCRENFVGEAFSVSLISRIEKFCAQEGNITIFRKFVVPQYRKTS